MTRLSRDQKRRKKLAERARRRDLGTRLAQQMHQLALLQEDALSSDRQALANKLHELAPGEIVWDKPEFDQLILEHGRTFPEPVKTVQGVENQCHKNCAAWAWLGWPAYRIATGYAYLKAMGRWVGHSWLVDGSTILETTHPRDIYFGTVLDRQDFSNFFVNHLLGILAAGGVRVEADPTGEFAIVSAA